MIKKLLAYLSREKYCIQQRAEIKKLHDIIDKLQQQNDSMRAGMRRCVTCDYRIDFKQRQQNTDQQSADSSTN